MSYKMSKDYRREWLKERHQHKYWKKKYKELEATIKDDNKDLKMSAVTEEEREIHEFRSTIIANLVAERDALKKELEACQEACKLKDKEIESLKSGLAKCLQATPLKKEDRQVADPEAAKEVAKGGEPDDGLSGGVVESKDGEEGAESKEDTSDGTSDDEGEEDEMPVEQVDLLRKLRF